MEYRNYLRKDNSGKLQNAFLHIKNIYMYMKSKNKDILYISSYYLKLLEYFLIYTSNTIFAIINFKGEKSKGAKFLSKLNKIAQKTFAIKRNVPISA